MTSFCSFLVFRQDEFKLIRSICAEAGWSVYGIIDPSMRFRFCAEGVREISQARLLSMSGGLREGEEYGEVLIFEAGQDEATNIIRLIRAANLILEGSPNRFSPSGHGYEISDDPIEREETFELVFRSAGYFEQFTFRETLPVAVAVAVKAWSDRRLIYAIHKLAQSIMTESVSPHSMHPRHRQVFQKHSPDFSSHVGTSIAINLAYSAIEELGLSVKANNKKPIWLDNDKSVWNPVVLDNLTARLNKAGVDAGQTIEWVIRGESSEVKVSPIRDTLAAYSDGGEVRDVELSLPDAINACQYMRNTMTAHAFNDKSTPLLGPYEVFNAQQVARFLMLSKCGLLNVWTDELKVRYT